MFPVVILRKGKINCLFNTQLQCTYSMRGNVIRIEDLAKELHLSTRQTERLVFANTGNTFGNELTLTRIAIAKHLIKTTDMKLSDVAEYVGYKSYAGFYKALNRDKNKQDGV